MEPFVLLHSEKKLPPIFQLNCWMEQDEFLRVGFSSRLGGLSEVPFASLNCGLHVGDEQTIVVNNRKRLAESAGFDFNTWTSAEQIHGNRVAIVDHKKIGRGREHYGDAIENADALVSNVMNVTLTAVFADCVPLYFWDPVGKVIGIAHAGWQGTVQRIAEKTIEAMVESFDCDVSQIKTAIGPSIGMCCYEVDEYVMEKIPSSQFETSYFITKDAGKSMLDLKDLNRQIMIKAGILSNHIEVSQICTSCQHHLLFSHRKEHGMTGRMTGWIGTNSSLTNMI